MAEQLFEKVIHDEVLFRGKVIELHHQQVELENGQLGDREVVRHKGAVAVLAEPEPNHLLFVTQYRTAPGEVLLEIPAGKLEEAESPLDCAKRELEEETGYRAGCIESLYEFYTSPGFADEKIHLFYATSLRAGLAQLDEDEFVRVHVFHRDEIVQRLRSQSIRDAKTLIAVLWWLRDQRETL